MWCETTLYWERYMKIIICFVHTTFPNLALIPSKLCPRILWLCLFSTDPLEHANTGTLLRTGESTFISYTRSTYTEYVHYITVWCRTNYNFFLSSPVIDYGHHQYRGTLTLLHCFILLLYIYTTTTTTTTTVVRLISDAHLNIAQPVQMLLFPGHHY
jgi:hypothetical protein